MPSQNNPLVNGIAVIIDDEIGKKGCNINDLISQIEDKGMPCVKLPELPVENDFITHLHGVSFILLDWKLYSIVDENGIPLADIPTDPYEANIKFLQEVKKLFAPVFIFTNEGVEFIKGELTKKKLYYDDRPNFIFVRSKSDLEGNTLFTEIETWIRENPPIYVLKTWEHEYREAQNRLFAEFYNLNPSWITALRKCFQADGLGESAVSAEIMSLIRDNISARMKMTGLQEGCLDDKSGLPDKAQIRGIIEHSRFIENDKLPKNEVRCGDVFLMEEKYFINIRPDCDCIPYRNDMNRTIATVDLYLLEGSIVYKKDILPLDFNKIIEKLQTEEHKKSLAKNDKNKQEILTKQQRILEEAYHISLLEKFGHFNERVNEVIIPFMHQGNTFSFKFRNIQIKSFSELGNRIGRLLPPFLTHVRTKYAQYLLRQGLPRIPQEAILSTQQENENEKSANKS